MAIVHKRSGDFGAVQVRNSVYTYETNAAITRTSSISNDNPFFGVSEKPYTIGSFKIIPRGYTNNMPLEIRDLLEQNHIAPGILRRQFFLLFGQGTALYKVEFLDGKKSKVWVEDKEVWNWLESWDHEDYLERVAIDYFHTQGYFSETIRNKGGRIKRGFINQLNHIGTHRAALEWPDTNEVIKNIIVGTWDQPNLKDFRKYPKFDKATVLKYPRTIAYNHLYSFARESYSIPGFQGTINWIKRSSDIPKVLESLTNNSLNIKWHIKSPQLYWTKKRDLLQEQCSLKGIIYEEKMLEEVKDQMFSGLSELLTGVDNIGKFFESESVLNEYGKLEGWEIIPIDMKVKDFIDAQLNISKRSDFTVASGLGLAPSLSNLSMDGNLSSGSEQLYALKLHLSTDTYIPERIITKAINDVIKINFPNKDVKLGFYHEVVNAEENVNPEKRVKNVV